MSFVLLCATHRADLKSVAHKVQDVILNPNARYQVSEQSIPNSPTVRIKVSNLRLCSATLSTSLFPTSTLTDVDLRETPSCLAEVHERGRLSTPAWIHDGAACLSWRGQSRSSNPHQVNHQPAVWRGSGELLTLCVSA